MAKNRDNYDEDLGVGSKILSVIITLLIIIILLGVLAACIKLDVGGIGNKVLRPVLKDIPVVNKILPEPTDEQLSKENNYSYDNLTDAVERIKELEMQNDKLREEADNSDKELAECLSEITRLKIFEEQQVKYEKNLKEFNENIVFNDNAPEIEEYKKYYEEIEPENAEELYRQVVQQLRADETVINLASAYSKMDPASAARALETNENISLVCEILTNMSQKAMAEIMNEMNSEFAAKVTNKINSENGVN